MTDINIARGVGQSGQSDTARDERAELAQASADNAELTRLIKKAMRGDTAAFEHLYKRYIKEIIYHARNLLLNPGDAEDAAQEAIIALHRNMKSLKSPYAFKSYLLRTVSSVCITRNRTVKQPNEQIEDYEEVLEDTTELGPQGSLEQMDLSQALKKVIAELPPRQREALSLRYFDDLDYEEIAQLLDITVNTVGSNILRAKKTLKHLIEKDGTLTSQGAGNQMHDEHKKNQEETSVSEATEQLSDLTEPQTIKGVAAAPAIGFAVAQLIEDSVRIESVERVAKGVAAVLAGSGAAASASVGMTLKAKLLIAALTVVTVTSGSAVVYGVYKTTTAQTTTIEISAEGAAEEGDTPEEFVPIARIEFSGGNIASETNVDGVIEHINPTKATLILEEGTAQEWEIVDGTNTQRAQGSGDTVEEVFAKLPPGSYTLGWIAVNDEGSKAIITRDFAIT